MGRFKDWLRRISGGEARERSQEYLESQEAQYQSSLDEVNRLFGDAPQIDLSQYIGDYRGYASELGRIGGQYGDILGGYRRGVDRYGGLADEYSGGLLDQYMGAAGDIEDISETALQESLGGYQNYLRGYQSLARQDIPGLDVYRGRAGERTASSMRRLRDMGGSSTDMASILSGESAQMRDLSVQSGMYRADRQQSLADAYAQYGQLAQSAYGQRAGSVAQAAGLRGAGFRGAAGIQQGLGLGSAMASASLASQEAGLRQSSIGAAANIMGAASGLEQQQFNINQYAPWQAQLGFQTGMAQQTMPYQAGMQFYGNIAAMQQAQMQQFGQGAMDIYGQFQNQGAQLGSMLMGTPMGAMGGGGGNQNPYAATPTYNQYMYGGAPVNQYSASPDFNLYMGR